MALNKVNNEPLPPLESGNKIDIQYNKVKKKSKLKSVEDIPLFFI